MRVLNPLEKNSIIHDMAMFCLALWIVLNTTFEFFSGYTVLSSLSMYLFLGAGAFWLLIKGRYTIAGNYYFVSLIFLEILILISTFFVPSTITKYVDMYTYRFSTNVVMAFIIINLIKDEKDIDYIFKAFVIGGVLLTIMFYSVYGFDVFEFEAMANDDESRFGWEFGNVNVLAQRCSFSLIFALYYMIFTKKKASKIWYLLIVAATFTVILFSGSRKSVLVVAFVAVFLIMNRQKRTGVGKRLTAVAGAIAVIVAIVVVIMTVPAFEVARVRLESLFEVFLGGNFSVSDMRRMVYIRRGLSQFLKSPFFGNGMCYSVYMFGTYTHNNFVEMLLNFGVVGFIIYYSSYYISMRKALSKQFGYDRKRKILFIGIILSILVTEMGIITYYDRNIVVLLCAVSKYYSDIVYVKVPEEEEEVEGFNEEYEEDFELSEDSE